MEDEKEGEPEHLRYKRTGLCGLHNYYKRIYVIVCAYTYDCIRIYARAFCKSIPKDKEPTKRMKVPNSLFPSNYQIRRSG